MPQWSRSAGPSSFNDAQTGRPANRLFDRTAGTPLNIHGVHPPPDASQPTLAARNIMHNALRSIHIPFTPTRRRGSSPWQHCYTWTRPYSLLACPSRVTSPTPSARSGWHSTPDGKVIYRDFHAEPLPHVDFSGVSAAFTAPEDRTPEQAAAFALREALASELEEADTVLIAAPIDNYTIASTLKAWLDQVIIKDRTFGASQSTKATPTIVVASRVG